MCGCCSSKSSSSSKPKKPEPEESKIEGENQKLIDYLKPMIDGFMENKVTRKYVEKFNKEFISISMEESTPEDKNLKLKKLKKDFDAKIKELYTEVKDKGKKAQEDILEQGVIEDPHALKDNYLSKATLQTILRRIDAPKDCMYDDAEKFLGKKAVEEIVGKFEQAHAFISQWAYEQIMQHKWDGWGKDSNFVASIADGNSAFEQAKQADIDPDNGISGIEFLEKKFGITKGNWSIYDKKPTNIMYRFIIEKPKKLKLRVPAGTEPGAYKEEWLAGGKTKGGVWEAVVDALEYDDLKEAIASKAVVIKKVTFDGKATKEEKLTKMRKDPKRQRSDSVESASDSEWEDD